LISVDDDSVRGRREVRRVHASRVPAREMDGLGTKLTREFLNHLIDRAKPGGFVGGSRSLADHLVVARVAAEDLRTDVADLSQLTVDAERESQAGAQRQYDLHAHSFDAAERGEGRVVHHSHVTTGPLAQDVFEREPAPLRLEVGIEVGAETTGS